MAANKPSEQNETATRYKAQYRAQHADNLWAHFINMGLAAWLITSPVILGYPTLAMTISDIAAGMALFIFAGLSLSWRCVWARWACALIGLWLLLAPLAFWTRSAAAYLNDTLVGIVVIGLAVLTRPTPGVAPAAAMSGPTFSPGWSLRPSSWFQRMPIIILALVGLLISRYLTAYQLEQIDNIWEPFFSGSQNDPQNGTEEIITSYVSEAWPVPDAGVGALTYALEILTGLVGSARRWRTMPWLVTLFGFMIVPLGAVSILFIIIQPVLLGTWCTLCLIAAAAMLIQIPYSLDELVATGQFLRRRYKAGRPFLKVFFIGDTDEGPTENTEDNFQQPLSTIVREILSGGVNVPWNLALCIAIGVWLMCTRLTLGTEGQMANWDHIVGSLTITVAVTGFAEVARPVRFLIIPLGLCQIIVTVLYSTDFTSLVSGLVCGLLLIALCVRRGRIEGRYGNWNRLLI